MDIVKQLLMLSFLFKKIKKMFYKISTIQNNSQHSQIFHCIALPKTIQTNNINFKAIIAISI